MSPNSLIIKGFIILILFLSPAYCIAADPPVSTNKATEQELMQLRLEKKITSEMEKIRSELDNRIVSELGNHRKYLQDLNDRFYSTIQFWLPILSGIIALIAAVFFWQVGKTRKEAFETAQATALAKATELAQKKVEETIIPEEIIETVKTLTEEAVSQIKTLKEKLIKEVAVELEAARDEVVKNKHEVIVQALDETIKQKFAKELDVLDRLNNVEESLSKVSKKTDTFEEAIKLEMVKQAVSREGKVLSIELGPSLKVAQKIAEILGRMLIRI